MSHRCCPKGTIGPVKDKEFLLMKYLESNTMWLPNKVYIGRMPKIIDEESVGSVGPGKGGAAMGCIIREGPLEQGRGNPALEEGQDAEKEPCSRKSFGENKRTSDSCRSPIGIAGLFKLVFQDTYCCPFFPINSCRWICVEEREKVTHRESTKASSPQSVVILWPTHLVAYVCVC